MLAFPKKKTTEDDDDDEEAQEVTTSLAVSQININAAVATVLAQLDGSVGIKRRTKSTAKAFQGGKKCFQLSPNWL